jgi:hypothetical protein
VGSQSSVRQMGSERLKLALVGCRRREPVFCFRFWFLEFPFRHIEMCIEFFKDTVSTFNKILNRRTTLHCLRVFYIRYYFLAYGDPALTCAVTSSVVYWARDGDQLFIYVREKGMGLIFRIVWFDDMNVLLKSYRFGRTSGDISHCPLARCKKWWHF